MHSMDHRRQPEQKAERDFFCSSHGRGFGAGTQVEQIVAENIAQWQQQGLVPDMAIEPGDKTDEPIRERGWTYWHHLFNATAITYR